MSPACVNKGGTESLICLREVPVADQELTLSQIAVERLAFWQVRTGEIITVCDPHGRFYRARLSALGQAAGAAVVFHPLDPSPESPLRIDVFQALPEKERFELILQKLTEIGVFRIIPFLSERSSTLQERDAGQKKSHRWPNVILRAAKQCRRGIIPELSPVLGWRDALKEASQAETRLVFSEKENANRLKDFFAGKGYSRHFALFVGPEGGFTPGEMREMASSNFFSLSLGPRILRTETAAIVGAALIQSICGDLG